MKTTKLIALALVASFGLPTIASAQSPLTAEVLASAPRSASVAMTKEVCLDGKDVKAVPQKVDNSTAVLIGELVGGVIGATLGTKLSPATSSTLKKAIAGTLGAAAGKAVGQRAGEIVADKMFEREVAEAKANLKPGQYINDAGYVCHGEESTRDVFKGYTSMVKVQGKPQPYVVATDKALTVGATMKVWFNREGDLELVP